MLVVPWWGSLALASIHTPSLTLSPSSEIDGAKKNNMFLYYKSSLCIYGVQLQYVLVQQERPSQVSHSKWTAQWTQLQNASRPDVHCTAKVKHCKRKILEIFFCKWGEPFRMTRGGWLECHICTMEDILPLESVNIHTNSLKNEENQVGWQEVDHSRECHNCTMGGILTPESVEPPSTQ